MELPLAKKESLIQDSFGLTTVSGLASTAVGKSSSAVSLSVISVISSPTLASCAGWPVLF